MNQLDKNLIALANKHAGDLMLLYREGLLEPMAENGDYHNILYGIRAEIKDVWYDYYGEDPGCVENVADFQDCGEWNCGNCYCNYLFGILKKYGGVDYAE